MLKAKEITKYYKDNVGVENFNMTLESGKGLGIIGVNGSGKTTFFKVLLGLLKQDSGMITFKGRDINLHSHSVLGYLPEERCLYKDLLVVDQVLFLGRLKGMSDDDIIDKLDEFLLFLNITQYKHMRINKLSKGNQQKVQIICALIHDPKIIILDEPLSGLDIVNVNLLKKLIYKLKSEGRYILMSSHHFEHIEEFCEDLIILKKGQITYSGTLDNLIRENNTFHIRMKQDLGDKYYKELNYDSFKKVGRFYEFEICDKNSAYNQFQKIVNCETDESISLVEASIEKIVRENGYI